MQRGETPNSRRHLCSQTRLREGNLSSSDVPVHSAWARTSSAMRLAIARSMLLPMRPWTNLSVPTNHWNSSSPMIGHLAFRPAPTTRQRADLFTGCVRDRAWFPQPHPPCKHCPFKPRLERYSCTSRRQRCTSTLSWECFTPGRDCKYLVSHLSVCQSGSVIRTSSSCRPRCRRICKRLAPRWWG